LGGGGEERPVGNISRRKKERKGRVHATLGERRRAMRKPDFSERENYSGGRKDLVP